mmetsp:Transcript_25587/g.46277  ORF Transcript_25587/g.46277 Transcript_25587/m.46277 type:complete len:86 (-) Transcript_25587:206-463(-)
MRPLQRQERNACHASSLRFRQKGRTSAMPARERGGFHEEGEAFGVGSHFVRHVHLLKWGHRKFMGNGRKMMMMRRMRRIILRGVR